MSLRARITTLLFVILAAVLVMAAVVFFTLNIASEALGRVQAAHVQYEAAVSLAEQANGYSEQIAETLLIGSSERTDYGRARDRVVQAFTRLRVQIEADVARLPPGPDRDREQAELDQLASMRSVYRDLENTAERTFFLVATGRRDVALNVFENQIEDGLDLRLQQGIAAAIEGEARELAEADQTFEALRQRFLVGVAAVAALLFAISTAAGIALFRAIDRPVRALTLGAGALEAGRLEHRIPVLAQDELGRLARRFNDMAGELARERDGLLNAQLTLEAQVSDRTRELETANHRLLEADEQRVAFLADVSHELRTPLTGLRSEAEVTLRAADQPVGVYRESLTRIVQQSAEMARLVEDLLFMARSDAGKVRFDRRRVTVGALVEPAARDAAALAAARGVNVEVGRLDRGVVMGDPRRLRQALVVLLDNAVRYSHPGGRVGLSATAEPGWLRLEVRDEGVGVPPEDLPHVFDRFFRSRRSSGINDGGSGLGLSIARWIVREHGGDVLLDSDGKGAVATLRLPLVCEFEPAARDLADA